MRFVNIPILTILFGLIGGIAITDIIAPSFLFVISSSLCLLATLTIHYLLATKRYAFRRGIIFHIGLTSVAVGMLITYLHTPTYNPKHYTQKLNTNEYYTLEAEVIEIISQTNYGTTFKANLLTANHNNTEGKILCFFPSKTITDDVNALAPTDKLVFVGKYTPISPPKNPYQFNYKQYMERKGVFGRVEIIAFSIVKNNTVDFMENIEKMRSHLTAVINQNFNRESAALLNTLLLGKRSDLDENIYQQYVDAGAVHVLAISGLHVGIITAILLLLLQKMPNLGFYRPLRYFILLAGLWTFALMAGASPSVLRATIMFSFVGLGTLIRRKQGRFDALMLSMLFLLLINPYYLYDVGFQLSYAAVFSIMKFYPVMRKWWQPENKYIRWIWSLFLVGLSAQIVVLPISLYYFHQFPILFFVSNLVVVPLLQPILIGGIIALCLGGLGILPYPIIFVLEKLITLMNILVAFIAHQEMFIIRNIPFTTPLLLSSLVIVLILIIFVHYRKYKVLVALLVSVLLFQGVLFYHKYQLETTEEMLVFSKYKDKIITIRQGNKLSIYQIDTTSINPMINNYIKNKGISDITLYKMPYILRFKQKNYLLMDSLGVYPKSKQVVIDSVIFLQKPKINLDRMKRDLSLR
ncbi:ComEC family competence protein [Capnocytophaga genosp. AHN8471]|uniref:ComEC family competence protein n=1 Tax=Capnocytophaga genosp. AHN8471 TaxID=327574 RepID=A0ABS1YVZ5_9FLAO|nr:ComEC/Rec2 family competence protein [Capnocytophaga genosp. AHN8471]MBM0650579.1 ComEC family competence protein [Capnocytophaga genosp. AHN8471]MBM0661767.1 ComEC family competence protein [Capnocytophaga genosp. AHN8471]